VNLACCVSGQDNGELDLLRTFEMRQSFATMSDDLGFCQLSAFFIPMTARPTPGRVEYTYDRRLCNCRHQIKNILCLGGLDVLAAET
jgi:hypothetical protein